MADLTCNGQDARYRQARPATVGVVDYWTEESNPSMFNAFKICQQLAKEGYGKAYFLLYLFYACKQDCERREQLAQHYYQLALDWCYVNHIMEDAELWFDLGYMCREKEDEDAFEQAAHWIGKSAERGFADAQYDLSECYRFGLGVPENRQEALRLCQLAADQGHIVAIANLKHMLSEAEHARIIRSS